MFTDHQKMEIIEYLIETPGRVYIGGDSQRYSKNGKAWAKFTVVFIVHIHNSKGGKIFHFSESEPVWDQHLDKPKLRLMTEVRKIVDTYIEFGELLEGREVEIHLDISPDEKNGSSAVVSEAIGYCMGMAGIKPKIKPDSWASYTAGDHYVRGKNRL